jgi:hypothetical protein
VRRRGLLADAFLAFSGADAMPAAAQGTADCPGAKPADDGSALAVWRFTDTVSGKDRIQAAFRRRGENFAPVSNASTDFDPYLRPTALRRGQVQGAPLGKSGQLVGAWTRAGA